VSTIHQIYCTHCTHGSSALERREGELARRTLGYSARAGSVGANELRKYYRQVERYTYYYLPRDTPGEDKLRLTAATAPRRLVYLPSSGGLQIVGHVCYRQTDTQGRPGSYFAHVLFRDENQQDGAWSAADCLRLWGAPGWVSEDSPDIPFILPSLDSLGEMRNSQPAAIDDKVFLGFLTAPAGGPFHDPGGVIPRRWREQDATARRQTFAEAFSALLAVVGQPRGSSLLLVVEPSVAALIFYGIVRLLPGGGIGDAISLSTFEPNPERLCTTLAATWLYDPQSTDLRPETYRSRAAVVNTIANRRQESPRPASAYVRCMIEKLAGGDWDAVDRMLSNLQLSGCRAAGDLEQLAEVDRLAPSLLQGRQPPAGDLHRSPMVADYLRRTLAFELARVEDLPSELGPLVGSEAGLLILELLAGETEIPGTGHAVELLMTGLSELQIPELIKLPGVADDRKLAVLARYVGEHGRLPPECEWLWEDAAAAEPARVGRALLPGLLPHLGRETLKRLYQNVADRHGVTFVTCLVQGCRGVRGGRRLLTAVIEAVDEQTLLEIHGRHGETFFREYPQDEPAMADKLHGILRSLPDRPDRFSQRLGVILAGEHLLPTDADQHQAAAWGRCRRAILEIGDLQPQRPSVTWLRPTAALEDACRRMTEAVALALPGDLLEDDRVGSKKQDLLRRIGAGLLGGRQLLPPTVWQHKALWKKIDWYFEMGKWPSARLGKMRPKSASLKSSRRALWLAFAGLAATMALGICIAPFVLPEDPQRQGPSPQGPRARTTDIAQQSTSAAAEARRRAERRRAAGRRAAAEKAARGRREAETAARKRAEEEAARRAAEEAQAAAARDAESRLAEARARAEQEAQQRAEAEVAEGAGRAEQWRHKARQFAHQHYGIFVEELVLTQGVARIPDADIEVRTNPPRLFLGAGRLQLDSGTYEFGEGFELSTPAVRQEIPQLAAELGCASVYVEIQHRTGGPCVVANMVPGGAPAQAEVRSANDRAKAEWNRRCRSITAIVYQNVRRPQAAGEPLSEAAPEVEPPAGQPAGAPPAATPGVEQIGGRLLVEAKPSGFRPDNVYMARVRLQVTTASGSTWPKWVRDDYVTHCVIREHSATGKVRTAELLAVSRPKAEQIFASTVKLEIRFEFYRRAENLPGAQPEKVVQSAWQNLQQIVSGTEYRIKFQIPREQLEKLRK